MLLQNRELGADAARLANIRVDGEAVLSPRHVVPQPQSGPSGAAVAARGLCLHPIQQGQAELLRTSTMARGLFRAYFADVAKPVIVLRPVHQANVAGVGAARAGSSVDDAAVEPQSPIRLVHIVLRGERMSAPLERNRIR